MVSNSLENLQSQTVAALWCFICYFPLIQSNSLSFNGLISFLEIIDYFCLLALCVFLATPKVEAEEISSPLFLWLLLDWQYFVQFLLFILLIQKLRVYCYSASGYLQYSAYLNNYASMYIWTKSQSFHQFHISSICYIILQIWNLWIQSPKYLLSSPLRKSL